MYRLGEIARRHRLIVIEDCAEAHGATCRDRRTGSFGDMGCFSFYANKIITTGEGGMVTTNDPALAERLRLLRNLAFTQPRYWHESPGFNFRMTGMQAAMGLAQLKKIHRLIKDKRRMARLYQRALRGIPGLRLPVELDWAHHVYWMFAVVVEDSFGCTRDDLVRHLAESGIESRTFFCPMNQQPFLRKQAGFRDVACPVADLLWETGLYLPSSPELSKATIEKIARSVREAPSRVAGTSKRRRAA
jgi:perosamine synthetase